MSCLGLLPPFKEQGDFRLSTDQRRESSGLSHIQATGGTTLTQDAVYSDRLSNTSECLFAQVLAGKIALHQARGCFTDRHGIRGCDSLNSGGKIGHFTQCQLLLTPCSTHFTDDDQPCIDTYTDGELDTFLLLKTGIEVSHGSKNSQTSPYCSVGVILMCLGIAEIDKQPVTEQLSDMPIVALNNFSTHLLIRPYHVTPVFGVKLGGE